MRKVQRLRVAHFVIVRLANVERRRIRRPPALPGILASRSVAMCRHQRASLQELPLLLPRVARELWEVLVHLPGYTYELRAAF
jgi:hypothetical protein